MALKISSFQSEELIDVSQDACTPRRTRSSAQVANATDDIAQKPTVVNDSPIQDEIAKASRTHRTRRTGRGGKLAHDSSKVMTSMYAKAHLGSHTNECRRRRLEVSRKEVQWVWLKRFNAKGGARSDTKDHAAHFKRKLDKKLCTKLVEPGESRLVSSCSSCQARGRQPLWFGTKSSDGYGHKQAQQNCCIWREFSSREIEAAAPRLQSKHQVANFEGFERPIEGCCLR